jgi:hypothetical protein
MGRERSIYGRAQKCSQIFSLNTPKRINYLGGLGVDGRIIMKGFLNK